MQADIIGQPIELIDEDLDAVAGGQMEGIIPVEGDLLGDIFSPPTVAVLSPPDVNISAGRIDNPSTRDTLRAG